MICQGSKFTVASIGQIDAELALLISGLSVSIGLFNLLPLRPLDGGRLALIAIEAFRGSVAKNDEKLLYRISSSILAGVTFISALVLFKVIG